MSKHAQEIEEFLKRLGGKYVGLKASAFDGSCIESFYIVVNRDTGEWKAVDPEDFEDIMDGDLWDTEEYFDEAVNYADKEGN